MGGWVETGIALPFSLLPCSSLSRSIWDMYSSFQKTSIEWFSSNHQSFRPVVTDVDVHAKVARASSLRAAFPALSPPKHFLTSLVAQFLTKSCRSWLSFCFPFLFLIALPSSQQARCVSQARCAPSASLRRSASARPGSRSSS